jgi:arylsulfatase A-like enzyme
MWLAALLSLALLPALSSSGKARNILMIVVDDLRPQIKAYGVPWMVTPHIDRLASQGVLFERAYVQQSICSPTRNSFLSGRYPDKTRTWNFIDDFRSGSPSGLKWTALPEFFRTQGFFVTGAGKVYHPNHPPNDDQNRSWSEQYLRNPPGAVPSACTCGGSGWPPHGQASCEGLAASSCGDENTASWAVGKLRMAANGTLSSEPGPQPPFFIGE